MNEIKICEYTKNDRMGCVKLLKGTFKLSEEDFAWRYESSKMHEQIIVCAKHNNDIVGFHSFTPWTFACNNKLYIGCQGGNAGTDIHFRRKGLQTMLINYSCKLALEKDIDFLFGVTRVGPTYKANCNAGFYPVAFYPLYHRFVNPFLNRYSEAEVVGNKQSINIMLSEEKKITPIVDDSYMEWRYCKNPKDYDFIKIQKDNNQALFCVRKRRERRYRVTHSDLLILDCQFSSLNDRFIKWAFKSLESLYSRKVMTMSIFFNENTERGRAIKKNIYHKRSSSLHDISLQVRPIRESLDLNIFLNHNNWDLLPHIQDWY